MVARYTKLLAYIILLLAFFYFFGYNNILRYLRGGITVVKHDEKTDGIPPPVISIKSIDSSLYDGICVQSSDVDDFKKCVDDLRKPFINKIQFKSYEQSYELEASGITEFIHPGKHSITEEMSPKLFLNKVRIILYDIVINFATFAFQSQEYFLFFLDPNYVLIANNPTIVPRSFVRPPKNVGHISFFLKVVCLIFTYD